MNSARWFGLSVMVIVMALAMLAQSASPPASKPATSPTSKPTSRPASRPTTKSTTKKKSTTAPALGARDSLDNELILFSAPPSPPWKAGEHTSEAAIFTTEDRLGQMQIAILPKDAAMNDNAAAAIAKELRAKRSKADVKVVMAATAEKDSRFAMRIHEKYKLQDKTLDSLHLYKSVGPKAIELLISTLSDDPDAVMEMQKVGEEVILSAKLNKKVFDSR